MNYLKKCLSSKYKLSISQLNSLRLFHAYTYIKNDSNYFLSCFSHRSAPVSRERNIIF